MTAFDPTKYLSKVGRADYLEVKWRLVWLRNDHPNAVITTQLYAYDQNEAVFSATIDIPGGGSATGWGSETPGDFNDYLEKAETKAIGRALAALGYGTQFTDDFDFGGEGGKVVDSPVQKPKSNPAGEPASEAQMKLVNKMLTEAGVVAQAYMAEVFPNGLTKAQASDLIKKIKAGEVKGEGGGEAALDPDAKPKSDVTVFWERAKELNLNNMQDVKDFLGEGLVGNAGGDFKKLLKLVNDKHTSEELEIPF